MTAETEWKAQSEQSNKIILTVNFEFLCETRLLCYRDKRARADMKREFRDMITMT